MPSKFVNTEAFIKRYGNQVEKEIKNRLKNAGKFASGKLYKSIRHDVKIEKGQFILRFFMEDYGRFVDKGVIGAESGKAGEGGKSEYKFKDKMPPEKPFRSWLKKRGIDKSKSFVIRRSIYLFGITPTNFFTIPTRRRLDFFNKELEKNMERDIDNLTTDSFK